MVGMQEIVAALKDALALLHHHLPWDRFPVTQNVLVAIVALVGLILCFWGARLLRAIFVAAFLAGGISVGIRVARIIPVDDLVGLVAGGAIAAIIGHLLYRWWVGLLAGFCAVVLVLAIGGPRVLPQVIKDFQDHLYAGGGEVYELPDPSSADEGSSGDAGYYWAQFWDYFWNQRRDFTTRMGLALGLAWVLGFVVGVTLTRMAAIVGTSLLGVLVVGLAGGSLLSMHWPTLWGQAQSQPGWLLGGLGLLLIISLSLQARGGRPVQMVAAGPAPQNK